MDRKKEEKKKKDIQDGIISTMTARLKTAEEAIKANRIKAFVDSTNSIGAENELREKIMKLTVRVDKLEKPMSTHRSLSYQSPYHVSDL